MCTKIYVHVPPLYPTNADAKAPHIEAVVEVTKKHGLLMRLSGEFARKGASSFSCMHCYTTFTRIVYLQACQKAVKSLGGSLGGVS